MLCVYIHNSVASPPQYEGATHDSVRGRPYRGLEMSAAVRVQLRAAQGALRRVLLGELRLLLLGWYHKLSRELDAAFEAEDEEARAPRPSPRAPRPAPLAPRPAPRAPRPAPRAPRPSPLAPRP